MLQKINRVNAVIEWGSRIPFLADPKSETGRDEAAMGMQYFARKGISRRANGFSTTINWQLTVTIIRNTLKLRSASVKSEKGLAVERFPNSILQRQNIQLGVGF